MIKQILLKVMNSEKLLAIGILFGIGMFFPSCFPKERLISFDKNKIEVSLCEKGTIEIVEIYGRIRDSENKLDYIGEIKAKKKGNQTVSLVEYNTGYDSIVGIKQIRPNFQYEIYIPYLDYQTVIIFYTDSLGKIDSVENPYTCEKH